MIVSSDVSNGFLPVVSDESNITPKVLILGSSPGKISLQQQQYYAHPRNSFWWMMSQILSFDQTASYDCRLNALTRSGVVLWDVLQQCERKGSLDSNILRQSELANDFGAFFKKHQTISAVFFNGKAAHSIFKRHFQSPMFKHIDYITLPSSSPAHASMSWGEKLDRWRVISQYLEVKDAK